MRHRLAFTWTLTLLFSACAPLAVVALATLSILERSALDAAERVRIASATAAAAVLLDHIDDGRNKLSAIAALLGDDDLTTPSTLANRVATDAALEFDRLLAPRDVFLEIGLRRTASANVVVSQVQSTDFGANQQKEFNDNNLPNQRLLTDLNQVIELLPEDDPRLEAARRGLPFAALAPEPSGGAVTLSLAHPARGDRILLARLDLTPVRELFARLFGQQARSIEILDAAGRPFLAAGSPVTDADALTSELPAGHGAWRIRVSESRAPALAPLATARRGLLLALSVALLLGVALSILFARRIVAPVRALAATAERFGAGELGARTGIERSDEIGQLAAAFDRMADSLAELDRLKSEFVAHASHELRTPLTSAKLALANVEEGLAGPEALARVRADLDRLVRLVNELLDLARIEAGIQLARAPTRLEDVAREVVLALQPLATAPVEVRGASEELALDRSRIHQVLVNLVDNALKHARTRVVIEIGARDVAVVDDGPGVPEGERERIFERFVRLDSAGSRPGVGLGLPIARKLVELHGGTLRCTGSAFVVRF